MRPLSILFFYTKYSCRTVLVSFPPQHCNVPLKRLCERLFRWFLWKFAVTSEHMLDMKVIQIFFNNKLRKIRVNIAWSGNILIPCHVQTCCTFKGVFAKLHILSEIGVLCIHAMLSINSKLISESIFHCFTKKYRNVISTTVMSTTVVEMTFMVTQYNWYV